MTIDTYLNKFAAGNRGQCPHCGIVVQFVKPFDGELVSINGNSKHVEIVSSECPACSGIVVVLAAYQPRESGYGGSNNLLDKYVAWPRESTRQVAPEVPGDIAFEYQEAAQVLTISPKASAALSRRCLQTVLREAGKASQWDLAKQIDYVLPNLPGYLQTQVDAIRNIGNFAAHPTKYADTGTIVDVEPGEAEWNLEVLDLLFDFYYVQPAVAEAKREALNKKLAEAGKPAMRVGIQKTPTITE